MGNGNGTRSWFVHDRERVSGPFTTEEAERAIEAGSGSTLVWWRGMQQWVTPETWYFLRDTIPAHADRKEPKEKAYYFEHERHVPRTLKEVVDLLRPAPSIQSIRLWFPVEGISRSIFESREVCEALKIPCRENVRAKLSGKALIMGDSLAAISVVETISAEGMGVIADPNLPLPKEVTIALRCEHLSDVPVFRTKVIYRQGEKIGLRFTNISAESRSRIIDYVKESEGAILQAA